MESEKREISSRYILKFSTKGGSNIFRLFDKSEKVDHFVASRRRWLKSGEKTVHDKRVLKTSGMMLNIKDQWQKSRRALRGSWKRRCRIKVRCHPGTKKVSGFLWNIDVDGQKNAEIPFQQWWCENGHHWIARTVENMWRNRYSH